MLRTGARKQGTMLYKILNDFKRDNFPKFSLVLQLKVTDHIEPAREKYQYFCPYIPDVDHAH